MQEHEDLTKGIDRRTCYGDNLPEIISNFLFFLKSYFINPLAISRAMKNKANFKFSLFIGIINIISSVLLFLGICLNCGAVLSEIYSGSVAIPISQAVLYGCLFSLLNAVCFFTMTFIVSFTKNARKANVREVISVFYSNTVGLSLLYLICFAVSFVSFYLSILIFLLSLFYFSIICTIGIEALTDAMIFGQQAFTISCVVSALLACLLFVFVAFLCLLYSSFTVDGEYLKDGFYIVFRYLK